MTQRSEWRRSTTLLAVLMLAIVTLVIGACASSPEPQPRCQSQLQRFDARLRAQQQQIEQQQQELQQLRTSEQRSADTIKRLRTTVNETAQQLTVERQQLAAARQQIHALNNPPKPIPGVQLINDIWGGIVNGAIQQALTTHQQQIDDCYAASMKRMASSAGWVMLRFDVTTKGLTGLRIHSKKLLDPKLGHCVLGAARNLTVKAPKGRWRVAQSVTFRLDRNVARSGDSPPDFKWPALPASMRAPVGGVCRLGSRAQMLPQKASLDPFAARPCQAGLRCCYGCGIPGCNSTCKNTNRCPAYP